MTFKEFLEKIEQAGIICKDWNDNYPELITKDWTTGGRTGGGWDRDNDEDTYHPRKSEPEPEMGELDKILELFYPNINFLQYKVLVKELITVSEEYSSDYYGNDEYYSRKKLSLKGLYEYLVDKGWVDGH
jgi:hypothetical protein